MYKKFEVGSEMYTHPLVVNHPIIVTASTLVASNVLRMACVSNLALGKINLLNIKSHRSNALCRKLSLAYIALCNNN
jgi:hypothetical protein